MNDDAPHLDELARCFEGLIPAVIATVSATGTPNVTYLSKVRRVDGERVALSNQFFSKTSRNLAEVPRASLLVVDPATYDEYRLTLAYERRDRRGPVFEQLRVDVDAIAALSGMEDVFRLRAADIYRVLDIERRPGHGPLPRTTAAAGGAALEPVAALCTRLSRCPDLDSLVDATVAGLADLLGHTHGMALLVDEAGDHLFTIASHGYDTEGVGSEVAIGEGIVGLAAQRGAPVRIGNLRQMAKYSSAVRRTLDTDRAVGPGWDVPLPALPRTQSSLAVPGLSGGEVVAVLVVESAEPAAFGPDDEAALTIVASVLASAVERARAAGDDTAPAPDAPPATAAGTAAATHVRFFAVDGSTFLDGEYLIRGVAGRLLWSLLRHHAEEGRTDFTNKEVRLDPSLELPPHRDNFESRLILLKRRLDERAAPIRIAKTGRGRFRLVVDGPLTLDEG